MEAYLYSMHIVSQGIIQMHHPGYCVLHSQKWACSIRHAADCLILIGVCSQTVELKVTAILHLGQVAASAKAYPLAKKKQTMEFLREKMHLRAR